MEDKVYILSDIHGAFQPVRDFWLEYKLSEKMKEHNNYLILLGDTGAQFFFNQRDEEFKKKLGKYPFTYFLLRGNHEQRPSIVMAQHPEQWHIEELWDNKVYVENDYPYIKYALDEGGEYNILGKSVLMLPGAVSVDKEYRLARGWSYFPDELMTDLEKENILNNLKPHYDYIFAHTCPRVFEPFIDDLFLSFLDQSQIDKSMENWLNIIINNTTYERFYFGHYHDDRDINPYKATMIYRKPIFFPPDAQTLWTFL
ncbi:MAG: metallophosphoesterase [Ruminococcus sp.]|nr:metallophosphoesterase [Ruminococcus sp.]